MRVDEGEHLLCDAGGAHDLDLLLCARRQKRLRYPPAHPPSRSLTLTSRAAHPPPHTRALSLCLKRAALSCSALARRTCDAEAKLSLKERLQENAE